MIAALRLVLGPVFSGLFTLFSTFIMQVVFASLFVAAGWFFRDSLFGMLNDMINYVVQGLNGVGLEIPSVGEMFQALPDGMLIAMKRVGLDEALAIVATAIAVRTVTSIFRWVRALNVLGAS
jgi:mannitol-specific phosphotransferase system IIBC component